MAGTTATVHYPMLISSDASALSFVSQLSMHALLVMNTWLRSQCYGNLVLLTELHQFVLDLFSKHYMVSSSPE
jgi:hypothetical protein